MLGGRLADHGRDLTVADPGVDLGQIPLRIWELNDNSTRWDQLVAAPSDETLVIWWSIWAAIFFLVGCFIWVVFLSIITSQTTRRSAFNLYVALLIVPDLIFTTPCVMTCAMNAMRGHYWSGTMCQWQAWYLIVGVAGSAWMNALICWEVYQLLRASHEGARYVPPTARQVILRSGGVLLYSFLIAALGAFELPAFIPYHTRLSRGSVCSPMEYDVASTVVFYCVVTPLLLLIPMTYILVCTYWVWRRDYLPATGKWRELAVYFLRIDVAFCIMWGPALFCFYIYAGNEWVFFLASMWGHCQGLMSSVLCLFKQDIRTAVWALLKCQQVPDDSASDRLPSFRRSGKRRMQRQGSTTFISGLSFPPGTTTNPAGLEDDNNVVIAPFSSSSRRRHWDIDEEVGHEEFTTSQQHTSQVSDDEEEEDDCAGHHHHQQQQQPTIDNGNDVTKSNTVATDQIPPPCLEMGGNSKGQAPRQGDEYLA